MISIALEMQSQFGGDYRNLGFVIGFYLDETFQVGNYCTLSVFRVNKGMGYNSSLPEY